jgi:hypothetical protein
VNGKVPNEGRRSTRQVPRVPNTQSTPITRHDLQCEEKEVVAGEKTKDGGGARDETRGGQSARKKFGSGWLYEGLARRSRAVERDGLLSGWLQEYRQR